MSWGWDEKDNWILKFLLFSDILWNIDCCWSTTHQVVSLWCWTQWGGQWHIIHATWEHFQILDMRPVLTNTRVSGHASCSHQHTCSGSRNIVELLCVMSLHLLEHSILLLIIATVPFFMKKNAQEHFFKKICFFSNY